MTILVGPAQRFHDSRQAKAKVKAKLKIKIFEAL
jgi:hypothetical protein